MKIGLLVGREETFPKIFLERLGALDRDDVTAEMVALGGTRADDLCQYDVIVDRISHDVPYFRMALKQAALSGTRLVNNPFWCAADDKFFGYSIASKLGVAVPKTVLLPNKDYSSAVSSESLRNLVFPIDWEAIVAYTGLPAFLKPADGGGWRGVNRVKSLEELLFHFDQSGEDTMVLQSAVDFDRYVRCFCFGREEVIIARYDPEQRAYLPLGDLLSPELEKRIVAESILINQALGYDMNTVEFAIADDIPWAIDFTNFAPDMEYYSITPEYFDRVVDGMVRLVLRLGDEGRHDTSDLISRSFLAESTVAPAKKAGKSTMSAKGSKTKKKKAVAEPADETAEPKAKRKGRSAAAAQRSIGVAGDEPAPPSAATGKGPWGRKKRETERR